MLETDEGAVDAGVPLTLRGCVLGVCGAFCVCIGEEMLAGEIDRFAGFRGMEVVGELTDRALS